MGISELNGLLRDRCPNVFVRRRLSDFTGRRIAIDANGWYYKIMAIANKKVVDTTDVAMTDPDRDAIVKSSLEAAFESICTFLSYGITPVFVFDGKHPANKSKTQQDRRQKKEDLLTKIREMREEFARMDILARDGRRVEDLRKLLRQCNHVASSEFEGFRHLLKAVGIPCLQATGEAEQLCSYLCIEGKVSAVFSADTDNLAYGCPLIITEFSEPFYDRATNSRIHQVMTVGIMDVLEGLSMTFPTFVDLCIMLGCDYNENISQIGTTRAYAIMQKFGSIDRIPRVFGHPSQIFAEACQCRLPKTRVYDTTVLKVAECRTQFSYRPSSETIGVFPEERLSKETEEKTKELKEPKEPKEPKDPKEPTEKEGPNPRDLLAETRGPQWMRISLDVQNMLADTARDVLSAADMLKYLPRLVGFYRQLPIPGDSQAPVGVWNQGPASAGPPTTPTIPKKLRLVVVP